MALAIPLLLILTAFVAYAMATLQHSQSTGLVGWLTGKLASLPIIGGLSVGQVLKLDQWVTNLIGRHFKQVERYAVKWLALLDQFTRRHAKAALSLGAPVWALAYWLVHTEIGRQAKAHDAPIAKTANEALAVASDARNRAVGHKTTPVVVKQGAAITKVEHVAMPHAQEWDWLTHHWGGLKKAISLAAVGALAPTLPRVHVPSVPWGLTPTRLRRMLRGLGVPLGLTALAVSVAAILRVTPHCLRDGNIGRVARRLCGLGPQALEDLLGLIADILILENICTIIGYLEDGLSLIEPELTAFIATAEKQFVHCKYELPANNTVAAPSLPPLTGLTLNPA